MAPAGVIDLEETCEQHGDVQLCVVHRERDVPVTNPRRSATATDELPSSRTVASFRAIVNKAIDRVEAAVEKVHGERPAARVRRHLLKCPIYFTNEGQFLGVCKARWHTDDTISLEIALNNWIVGSDKLLMGVLVHEMCHGADAVVQGESWFSGRGIHGPRWKALARAAGVAAEAFPDPRDLDRRYVNKFAPDWFHELITPQPGSRTVSKPTRVVPDRDPLPTPPPAPRRRAAPAPAPTPAKPKGKTPTFDIDELRNSDAVMFRAEMLNEIKKIVRIKRQQKIGEYVWALVAPGGYEALKKKYVLTYYDNIEGSPVYVVGMRHNPAIVIYVADGFESSDLGEVEDWAQRVANQSGRGVVIKQRTLEGMEIIGVAQPDPGVQVVGGRERRFSRMPGLPRRAP